MTIDDYRTLTPSEQKALRWICWDWEAGQPVGFFKHPEQADAMTQRGNAGSAADWNGLPRYQTVEEEDLPPGDE